VRDIAKKSGISIGSLYDYIQNKEDILQLLTSEFLAYLKDEVVKVLEGEKDVVRQLEGTLETMLRVVDRFQEYTLPVKIIQNRLMDSFTDPVGLGAPGLGFGMLDLIKLEKQLVGMPIQSPTELRPPGRLTPRDGVSRSFLAAFKAANWASV